MFTSETHIKDEEPSNSGTQDSKTKVKVKSTIPHEECWWGAHLPYLGLEPVGG